MKFLILGREIEPAEDLTLGEARDIKRISGLNMGTFGEAADSGDPDALIAFVYVSARRVLPTITLEDVEAVEMSKLIVADEDGDEDAAPLAVTAEPALSAPKRAKSGARA